MLFYQGNERGNDERNARKEQCAELVDKRLARPGRHHNQSMLARQHARDGLGLSGTERGESEILVQRHAEILRHEAPSILAQICHRREDAQLTLRSDSQCRAQ